KAPLRGGAPEFGTVNVQVPGIREPDIVGNNGTFIFLARRGVVEAYRAWPPSNITLAATLDLNSIVEGSLGGGRLVIKDSLGEHTVAVVDYKATVRGVLVYGGGLIALGVATPSIPLVAPKTFIAYFTPGLRLKWIEFLPGAFYDARLFNDTLLVVTWSMSPIRPIILRAAGNNTVADAGFKGNAFLAGLGRDAVVVSAINMSTGKGSYSIIVGTRPYSLYVSPKGNVYLAVAGTDYLRKVLGANFSLGDLEEKLRSLPKQSGFPTPVFLPRGNTTIVRFKATPGSVEPAAHTTITGTVRKQWQIDEYEGFLRVVVDDPYSGDVSLYVFNATTLTPLSSLHHIAVRERIHAVRFLGNMLYVVTYRRVDPLFAINLTVPEKPRIIGFLKAPGFDEYLHPLPGGKLLGVGREGGRLRVTLYSLQNGAPLVLSRIYVGGKEARWVWSPVLDPRTGHRAFTYHPRLSLLLLPVRIGFAAAKPGAAGLAGDGVALVQVDLTRGVLRLRGFIPHPGVERATYIDSIGYSIAPSNPVRVKAFNTTSAAIVAESTMPATTSIAEILRDPAKYAGRSVVVEGVFMGWKASSAGPPPVTRSDWVLRQDGYEIYVAATKPGTMPGDPVKDAGRLIVRVTAVVKISPKRVPYLDPIEVQVVGGIEE
ncbi:MAG: hypothetical protein DSY37_01760, partial [Hyperthermus sp.]